MAETQAHELAPLRFVIPLDGSREEDRALAELFTDVSNGNLGAVARLLLQRGLASCGDTVDDLLLAAMREQAARNRLRGRPRTGSTRARTAASAKNGEAAPSVVGAEQRVAVPAAKSDVQSVAAVVAQASAQHQEPAVAAVTREPSPREASSAAPAAAAEAAKSSKRPVDVSGLMSWNQ
ncbi:hypothetical protein [Ralstonia sp. ASV6]|uniref:hypothetical protein n=1 Tax=Ralstonia sp. ASV6 TaxID=2795124 RepID=UPI0018ED4C8E|nr:hypothetical protein [Ralstonia sp. ASV6]